MTPMRGRSLLAIPALVILGAAVHASALGGWWLYDDPQLLIEAIRQPLPAIFFNPIEYAHLASHTFAPMQLLSFKLDLLYGIRPRHFYVHQLLDLIGAAVLLYWLLRRYIADSYAFIGAAVFLTTWESVYAARTLMIRHYVEGLLFALAALLIWSYRNRWGTLFYLLAMLSKEVYAPIPLFLICQERFEGRSWREIARKLILPADAFIVILIWRWYMTGLIGTYLPLRSLLTLPHSLWIHLVGPAPLWVQVVWGICVAGALLILIVARRYGFVAATIAAAILPILPLAATYFQWRYSFAFVAFVVGAMSIALGVRRLAAAFLAVLLCTTLIVSIRQKREYEQLTRKGIELEGRYVWNEPNSAPALAATAPAWYLDGLAWLRNRAGRGQGPESVFSRYAITLGKFDPDRMVAISNGRRVPLTATSLFGAPAEWQRARMQFDGHAPLSIEFTIRNHDAAWRLGPPGGRFVFLTDPGYSAVSVPAVGSQRVPTAREQQFFRIVREEADGRWTASPPLAVPREGSTVVWRRSM